MTKSLSHSQARDWLQQTADGLLKPEQQRLLEHHLEGCAECRAFAAELASLEGALTGLFQQRWGKPSMTKGTEQNLVKQLQESFLQGSAGGGKPPGTLPWIVLFLAAVFGLFLLFRGTAASTGGATPSNTVTATPSPSSTMTPTETHTATATQAVVSLITMPIRNANCRLGPSASLFEIDDTLLMDTEYLPVAQGPDAMWLLFAGPISQNRCWVFVDNLELFCSDTPVEIADISPCTLAIANYPPLPTLTPTPTFTPEPDEPTDTPDLPQCSDGIDNDGDGDIDMKDGRCTSPNDDSENR